MQRVYIVGAKRSAIASFLGSLSSLSAPQIGAKVIKDLLKSTAIEAANLDEVILGNVLSAGLGQGPGRQAAVWGAIPYSVPAYTINMICGSGMKALMLAGDRIRSGGADLILAGGMESMSQAGFVAPGSIRRGQKIANLTLVDHILSDALSDAFTNIHMGVTAENIARKYKISRAEQDEFAYKSQLKAIAALDKGFFKDEISPIEVKIRREMQEFTVDEYPKRSTSLQKLAALKPAFEADGTVTAGNASGINDGAAILVLASEKAVSKYALSPMAELLGWEQGGVDPQFMGLGPVPAIGKVLSKNDLALQDIDLIELNEAFAAQALGLIRVLAEQHKVPESSLTERINIYGGAISLGHPIAASGARIVTTLIHSMKRNSLQTGLASLCVGGGMGTAVILSRKNL